MTTEQAQERRAEQERESLRWINAHPEREQAYRASRRDNDRVMAVIPVDDLAILVGLARIHHYGAYDLGIPMRVADGALMRSAAQLEPTAERWLTEALAAYRAHVAHWSAER